MALLEPKEITVKTQKGEEKTYIISKFPAVAGREIVAKYPLSGMPKVGDYALNEETMYKLMAYVAVPIKDRPEPQTLTTKALIDNHVPDWETLAKIEVGMMEYNCSFFANGAASNFLKGFASSLKTSIIKTVMDSLQQSSPKTKRRSTN